MSATARLLVRRWQHGRLGSSRREGSVNPKGSLRETGQDVQSDISRRCGREAPRQEQSKIHTEAWAICFAEFEEWYERKWQTLTG